MQCVRCGKNFSSHTDGSEVCWDCYMKDYDDYVKQNFSEALLTMQPSNCDLPLPNGFGKQEGWICPVCGRGLAPWVSFCPCQSDMKITYGTSTTTDIDELNELFRLNDQRVDEMVDFLKRYDK